MVCPATVHETVCVQANVTITPQVTTGTVQSFCVGGPVIGPCVGTVARNCTFTVSQALCVQVPLVFAANAVATPAGIVCGTPLTGECPNQTAGCTHSQGFFRTHEEITNALIELAGGSIVLGIDNQGASFTVTTANVGLVFSGDIPSPPAPTDIALNAQYDALYIQLLAAKLNVLNGATCPFALQTIEDADEFLATSPAAGKDGAPALTEDLTDFNEGDAEGCPEHCPDDDNGDDIG